MRSHSHTASAVTTQSEAYSPCENCNVAQMSLCHALSCEELRELSAISTSLEVGRGVTIINETDSADYLFNVTAGSIKLFKLLPDGRRQMTGFLFPGDFLGIAMNDLYAYSAEAIEDSRLCRFPREKLEGLLSRLPQLENRLLNMVSHELVLAQDQMLLLGRKTAVEKVSSFLITLVKRGGESSADKHLVPLPMGRSDIGDYLGLTTETVSRTLTNLKKQKIIAIPSGGGIEILDQESLNELAEGLD
ncbi:helix-turn-helix domain-containing protein [Kiloniella laminariae]|uniref:Helix-turn-helix domain-containing protein n=1 Tax=Kiloniella laminariae TaxID=454162 RepID=A0ABT4LG70_9PROT|nr:cyclic nucleotide-binding domain-containing protein [Kiloniella laminariae]MCZ4280106.1 helix-turn-helix domain-containing protein [Kiloniella laminariae]